MCIFTRGGLTSASRRAAGREVCGYVRGGEGGWGKAEQGRSVREGEESVVPVRAEGAGSRAAAQGRGRRARAIVEKGAGPALR